MNKTLSKQPDRGVGVFHRIRILSGALGLASLLLAAHSASAQTIVAYDTGEGYGSLSGNRGFGFGSWVVSGPGGTFIDGAAPYDFALWNSTVNSAKTAIRPFNTPLLVGGSFSVQLRIGNLDVNGALDGIRLRDASGNVLFSYYHQHNDVTNGWIVDATGTNTATGFSYKFAQDATYTFTLNSATTYTFTDNTTSATFSGTLSGAPIVDVVFFRENGPAAPPNGQDFRFNTLIVTSPALLPPPFLRHPVNTLGTVGGTVSLTAMAASSQPISYQWYQGNVPVSGGTSTNLVMTNVDATKAGSYSLVATVAAGSTTSRVAVVTLVPFGYTNGFDSAAGYSGISGNRGFGFGTWAVTTTASSGSGLRSGWWSLWASGASAKSTATRPFSSNLPVGGTFLVQMRMAAINGADSHTGIQLQDAAGTPLFTYWHQGDDVSNGHITDANGTSTATGFSYEASEVTHSVAFVLNSETTYTFYDITAGASFSGTLSAGAAISKVAFFRENLVQFGNGQDFSFNNLTFITPVSNPPQWTLQPVSGGAMVSNTVTLSALAASPRPISYQWYHGGTLISGATAPNLVLGNLQLSDAGNYVITASDSFGSTTSSVAAVAVLPYGVTNGFDTGAGYGGVTGNRGYGFGSWAVSGGGGSYVDTGAPYAFAIWVNQANNTETALRPFNSPIPVGGTFWGQLRMAYLNGTDSHAGIQLQDAAGNVLFAYWHQGGDDLSGEGHFTDANGDHTVTGFTFEAQRTDNFAFVLNSATTYTFYDITAGASFSGTLSGAEISQVAFVRANLGAGFENGQDMRFNTLMLTAPGGNPPTVGTLYSSGGLVGSTISLNASAASSQPVTYQWYKGSTLLVGETNATLTLGNASMTNVGSYSVVASSVFGSSTSAVATVTVFAANNRLLAYEGFSDIDPSGVTLPIGEQNGGSGWGAPWVNRDAANPYSVFTYGGNLTAATNAPEGFDARSIGSTLNTGDSSRAGRFLDCSSTGVFAAHGYLDSLGNIGADGKTIYVSFLQQPYATSAFYEFEFYRGGIGDRIGGVGNDLSGTTVNLRTGGTQTPIGEGDASMPNFYVVRVDFKAGNDDVRVYRNPTSLTEPGEPTLTMPGASDMSFNALGAASFSGETLMVDEIRVGATWKDALGLPDSSVQKLTRAAQGWNINFAGTPGYTYRVLRANVITGPWSEVGTVTVPESAIGTINDTYPQASATFYRVVTP